MLVLVVFAFYVVLCPPPNMGVGQFIQPHVQFLNQQCQPKGTGIMLAHVGCGPSLSVFEQDMATCRPRDVLFSCPKPCLLPI